MDQNKIKPNEIALNTKFLNSLQHEFGKYVTLTRQSHTLSKDHFDRLHDYLSQCEPHVNASQANKNSRNDDPMALVANSYENPSYSHASLSYSRLPQPYYVTHPSHVHYYDGDYQGVIHGDAQEDKLSTAMMMLARAITQHFSTPTNNRLPTSSNTRNQAGDPEQRNHEKFKTIKHAYVDDQIDSDIHFDDPYVEDKSGQTKHDQDAYDQTFAGLESLIYNVQVKAEKQRIMNCEMKKKIALIQRELETCKERAFKVKEDKHLDDIVMLGEILKSHKSRLKMEDKMIQLDYAKLNKLYESFVHQKEIFADQTCLSSPSTSNVTPEISPQWSSKPPKEMPKENHLLKLRVSPEKEIQNMDRLVYIKTTRAQHQREVNDIIEYVNQNTYAYGDARSKNQDLLMIISELKDKLQFVEQGKNVNTKFVRSAILGKLICVILMNKNKELKSKIVPKFKIKKDLSKAVTSCSSAKIEQVKSNTNVIARGMYRVIKTETQMLVAKPNIISSNSTRVASTSSVSRPKSKSINLKKSVMLNTYSKSTSKEFKKHPSSGSFVSNKSNTLNSNVSKPKANVLNAKVVNDLNDGSNV
nr:hypothetical protein [Tanacetum cinerariifolium]